MSSPFLGEVRPFPYNFAPRGWAFCQGQILSISQNTALFSLLGTFYGGNGTSTFALPDLRGRVAVSQGTGAGLSSYVIGEQTGAGTCTLLSTEMPAHTHVPYTRVQPVTELATKMRPTAQAGDYLTRFNTLPTVVGKMWNTPPLENSTTLHPSFIGLAGGNQPHNNVQPVLAINYCIAMQGVFPARN
jgi:microcystin-dependent protein